jgi:hypothetical protein
VRCRSMWCFARKIRACLGWMHVVSWMEPSLQFFDRHGWTGPGVHRVAVGTQESEVSDGVDLVVGWNQGQFHRVVDVDEGVTGLAVAVLDPSGRGMGTSFLMAEASSGQVSGLRGRAQRPSGLTGSRC